MNQRWINGGELKPVDIYCYLKARQDEGIASAKAKHLRRSKTSIAAEFEQAYK